MAGFPTAARGGVLGWRRMPPAVFPPALGLMGLGLAWRKAGALWGFGPAAGDMILGAASLIVLFFLLLYLAKIAARPAVLVEDVSVPPARAGVAAGTMALMLTGAALVPIWPEAARWAVMIGMLMHVAVVLAVAATLVRNPSLVLAAPGTLHLPFVGLIVAPLALVPLGSVFLAEWIFRITFPFAVLIWLVEVLRPVGAPRPAPLRPTMAIHLSPVALFGIVAALLGWQDIAGMFRFLGVVVAALLVAMVLWKGWLIEAGFSPVWGAFTFPTAAAASLWFTGAGAHEGWKWLATATLIFASVLLPWIAVRIWALWPSGRLADKTAAAVA